MKKIFFALILNFFLVQTVSASQDLSKYYDECLSFTHPPKVTLTSSYGKLRYKRKDKEFLRKHTPAPIMNADGLTTVPLRYDYNFQVNVLTLSHQYKCVYPEVIDVRLEYMFPIIYIDEELKEGMCRYELVKRHEDVHMRIHIEALDYFLPRFKRYLSSQYKKYGVIVVAPDESVEEAVNKLHDKYQKNADMQVQRWQSAVTKQQAKLDNEKNYLMENSICLDKSNQ